MAKNCESDFVADGYGRAWSAVEPAVREQVEREFAAKWNASGVVGRWFLLRQIEREIIRRIELKAPEDAFY